MPQLLKEVAPRSTNAVGLTCGPPIMIKFVLKELLDSGFKDEDIITTLGDADEVWDGHVWALQYRQSLCLQGRACIFIG